ncbi:MAG: PQQ-binding-like beta-propeller repeat protein [Gammaproteobacteria bacterium]|nr:PQQ-binding-like beta-propeller repeat protein [Gammaproteobacteria bacterium]
MIALDPQTGKERWSFDPQDPLEGKKIGMRKCRGVSNWVDREAADGAACKSRIFVGTADYRLVAIDANNGKPCEGFGDNGVVRMPASKPELFPGELVATSHPAVVNDVLVVGLAVADNQRVDAPSGRVLAFDARTGKRCGSSTRCLAVRPIRPPGAGPGARAKATAAAMSGRRWRSIRSSISSTSRPPARRAISMAATVPATTITRPRSSRCAVQPAKWRGTSGRAPQRVRFRRAVAADADRLSAQRRDGSGAGAEHQDGADLRLRPRYRRAAGPDRRAPRAPGRQGRGAKCCRRPNRFPSACPRSDRWDSLPRTRGDSRRSTDGCVAKGSRSSTTDRSTRLPAKRERSSRHPSAAVPTGVAAPMTRRATSWWFRPIAYPWS